MASDDVIVKLTAEISGLEKGMQKGAAAVQGLEKKMGSAVTNMKRALALLGVAVVAREFVQLADASANLNARIKLVAGSTANATKLQKELLDVANRTRVGFESVVTLYTRLGRSADALGISQSRLLGFTETFSQALKISGATTAEANATVIQLSQAMGSGVLRGEEFRAIMEQGGRAAIALAAGLGVPIGKLREMAEAGELTSAKVIAAIESQSQKIQSEFNEMPTTVGDALTVVQNKLLNFGGNLDQSSGATRELVTAVNKLGALLDDPDFAAGIVSALTGLVKVMTALGEATSWVGRQMAYLASFDEFIDKLSGVAPAGGGVQGRAAGGIGLMPGSGGGAGWSPGAGPPPAPKGGAGGGGKDKAKTELERLTEANAKYVDQLKFERDIMNLSEVDQKVQIALRGLNAKATQEQITQTKAWTRELFENEQQLQKNAEIEAFAAEINEKYGDGSKRILEITTQLNEALTAGAITWAEYSKALEDATKPEDLKELEDTWTAIGEQINGAFADTFTDIVSGAEDAGEAIKRLIVQVIELIAQQLILQAIQGATGGGGGLGGAIASLFRADGGPVNRGTPYIVGERGPELFVPNAGGGIVPNGKMGGGGNFVYAPTLNAPGADASTLAQMRTMLAHQKQDILSMMPKVIKENTARGRF